MSIQVQELAKPKYKRSCAEFDLIRYGQQYKKNHISLWGEDGDREGDEGDKPVDRGETRLLP